MPTDALSELRLFQLVSPSLPTGAFSYSQGLEWEVECGHIVDAESLAGWLESLLFTAFAELEIPLLNRLYSAAAEKNLERFTYWSRYTLACRETAELREEEQNRGRAMAKLLSQLAPELQNDWVTAAARSQLAGFALLAFHWTITVNKAAQGYTWSWLENMVMGGVKVIPLGQTAGQQTLAGLFPPATEATARGLTVQDDRLGGSCPAFAIASSLHETQYSRLFRS